MNKTIHSTALSNNKGDPARTRSVNKHVQRWRAKTSTGKRPAVEPKGPTVIGWRLDDLSKPGKRTPSDLNTVAGNPGGEEDQNRAIAALSTILTALPPRWGSPVDPFQTSSVPLTSEVFGFLRYFTESFLSAAVQTQVQNVLSPKKVPTTEHVASRRIIQECVADEKHMYSVLALTSHQIKYAVGHQLPRMDRPEFYMAKAIKGLRKSLDAADVDALGQQAVLDIAWMATAESYIGNFAGAMAHHRICLYLVERMGGWDKIDAFVREMCRIGDIFVSSLTLTPPMFGLQGDPGPISRTLRAEIDARIRVQRRMGGAFLRHDGVWDEEMADVLPHLLDVVQAAQFLWAFPDADVGVEDRDWVLQRSHALTYRLLCLVPRTDPATVEQALQEACRLCFVLWLFYVLAGTAGVPDPGKPGGLKRVRNVMREHVCRLRRSVVRVDGLAAARSRERGHRAEDGRWGAYDDLLLWVLAFGTLSCKLDASWFAGELATEARARGLWTFDSLVGRGGVGGYLPLDRLELLTGRRVARLLIGGLGLM